MSVSRLLLPLIIVGISDSSQIPHSQQVDEVSNYLRTETGIKNCLGHTFAYEHVTSQKIITGCEGSKFDSGEMKVHFYFIDATGKKQSILNPRESFEVVMPSPDALPEFLRTKKLFMSDLCFHEACEAGTCGSVLKAAEWRIPTFPWFSFVGKAEKDGASLNAADSSQFNLDTGASGASVDKSASVDASGDLAKDSVPAASVVTTSQSSSTSQANEAKPAVTQINHSSITNADNSNSSSDDFGNSDSSTSAGTVSYNTATTSSTTSSSPSIVSVSCGSTTPTKTCGCCEHCPAYKAIEQLIAAKLESQLTNNPWPFPTAPSANNFLWNHNPPAANRERTDQLEPTWPFNLSPQPKLAKETTDPSFFASLPGAIRGQAPVIYYPSCDPDAFYQPAIINYCTDYSDTPSGDFQQDSSPQLNASQTLVTPN